MLTLLHLPGCEMPSGLNQMCHDFFWPQGAIYKYNTDLLSWYKVVGTVVYSTSCRCGATLRLIVSLVVGHLESLRSIFTLFVSLFLGSSS